MKKIEVCMKCGSGNLNSNPGGIYSAQTAYGMSGAMSGKVLCNKCGHYGFPVLFVREKESQFDDKAKKFSQDSTPVPESGKKNPYIAAFASLLVAGAGQAYCGHLKRGLVIFGLTYFLLILVYVFEFIYIEFLDSISYVALALPILFGLLNVWDAFRLAQGKPFF